LIMTEDPKYDMYDIEELMLEKSYYELAANEREFVLEHVDTEQAYEDMRKTLLNINAAGQSEELLTPPPRMKAALMAEFAQEQDRRPMYIWLNAIPATLFPAGKSMHRQPGIQAALAAMIVVAFLFFGPDFSGTNPTVGNDIVASNETPASKSEASEPAPTPTDVKQELAADVSEEETDLDNIGQADADQQQPLARNSTEVNSLESDEVLAPATDEFYAAVMEDPIAAPADGVAPAEFDFDSELSNVLADETGAGDGDAPEGAPLVTRDEFNLFGQNSDLAMMEDEEAEMTALYKAKDVAARETAPEYGDVALAAGTSSDTTAVDVTTWTGNANATSTDSYTENEIADNVGNATTLESGEANLEDFRSADDKGAKLEEVKLSEQSNAAVAQQPTELSEIAMQSVENSATTRDENARADKARTKNNRARAKKNDAVNTTAPVTTSADEPGHTMALGGATVHAEKEVINGRSLADDEELISIFFTAL
jgi:hypothetical protein